MKKSRGLIIPALGVLAFLCSGCGSASGPPPSGAGETHAVKADEAFTCLENGVTDRVPPPIEDLAEQRAVIDRVTAASWPFRIRVLEPSLLGPVALVDGNVDLAARSLGKAGVAVVYPYDDGPEDDNSDDPRGKVTGALGWKVYEAEPVVRRVARHAPGYVDMWVWPEAGSIQLFWHGEIPAEVQALVGTLPNGVRLDPINQVPYANKVLMKAQNAVFADATPREIRDVLSFGGRCHDYRGIRVGVTDQDEVRRAEIAQVLAAQVGVPVMVVYEERGTLD